MTKNSIKVHYTHDLEQFGTVKGNRKIDLAHAKKIEMSIAHNGLLVKPIIVNENLEVIDGQHRLEACKMAKIPIYYIIVEGYGFEEITALNESQKNWSYKEYLESYAENEIESYVILQNFLKKHPKINISCGIAICSNTTLGVELSYATKNSITYKINHFINGTWEVKDMQVAEMYVNRLYEIEYHFEHAFSDTFIRAILALFKNPVFSYDIFIEKIAKNPMSLMRCANRKQYIELIEKIYNKYNKKKVNLRI